MTTFNLNEYDMQGLDFQDILDLAQYFHNVAYKDRKRLAGVFAVFLWYVKETEGHKMELSKLLALKHRFITNALKQGVN